MENVIEKNRPKGCILLLTLECILKCKMCHLWRVKQNDSDMPSLEEWKDFISSFDGFVEKGTPENRFTVTFGGGEPLLRKKELLELMKVCFEKDYWASIATNGYLLSEELIREFIGLKLHYLGISLDSLEEETHDNLRGTKGSYKKVMESIECLSGLSGIPHLAINTIIMEPNINGILDLTQWAIHKDRVSSISFQAVMQPFHDPMLEDWYRHEENIMLWPKDMKNLKSVIDGLIKIKKDSLNTNKRDKIGNPVSQLEVFKNYFIEPGNFLKQIKCKVLDSGFFAISPNGGVNLCPFTEPIGNIKNSSLEKLWYSEKAEEVRNKMLLCTRACHHLINCWYEEQ